MSSPKIKVQIVADLPMFIPQYKTPGSAAADIVANIPEGDIVILPGERELIDAGFCMFLPTGWEAQIRPRSGLAVKYGLQVTNSPGTIDCDYTGRIKVVVNNTGKGPILIRHGERFAQICLKPVYIFDWEEVESLPETERGSNGFGSTGT
jgi:dUTP pyrophosphatase